MGASGGFRIAATSGRTLMIILHGGVRIIHLRTEYHVQIYWWRNGVPRTYFNYHFLRASATTFCTDLLIYLDGWFCDAAPNPHAGRFCFRIWDWLCAGAHPN